MFIFFREKKLMSPINLGRGLKIPHDKKKETNILYARS